MSFYTNVQLVGDNLLYLGYEDGQRIQRKFKFSPTLFVVTKKFIPELRSISPVYKYKKQDNNIWNKEDLRKLETLCKSL